MTSHTIWHTKLHDCNLCKATCKLCTCNLEHSPKYDLATYLWCELFWHSKILYHTVCMKMVACYSTESTRIKLKIWKGSIVTADNTQS